MLVFQKFEAGKARIIYLWESFQSTEPALPYDEDLVK